MVMAITFDTLQFVKTLVAADMPQKQAEACAKAFKEAHSENLDCLATKQDIREVKQEIDLKCEQLKTELIKWVLTIVFTVSAAQAAIIGLLIKFLR